MHELPDEYLADAMPVAKKIALAVGAVDYNVLQVIQISIFNSILYMMLTDMILQNNGRIAHQVRPREVCNSIFECIKRYLVQMVDHVHFHVIPKPSSSESEGLVIGWPQQQPDMDELKKLHEEIKSRL
jgi:diadenosine tetraphosphate (Ap4A) HIT family hydrolase